MCSVLLSKNHEVSNTHYYIVSHENVLCKMLFDSLDLPQTNQVNPFRLVSSEVGFQALRMNRI